MRRTVLVFDLDGTLIHSLPDLAIALNRLLEEEGRRKLYEDEVAVMVGDGAAMLVRRALTATGAVDEAVLPALTQRFLALYEGNAALNTRAWPGVPEALAELAAAGWRMAVCTNKPQAATVEILVALGLAPYFQAVVGGDRVEWRKPDPRHVAATLAELGARPEQAVMIGDSPNDVAAGRAAGLPVVAVSFGYTRVPPAELKADRLIDHFADLPATLAAMA